MLKSFSLPGGLSEDATVARWPPKYFCGLYYKSCTIVIYDRNDSSKYYKTMIMIASCAPNLALVIASVVNYDLKWCHNLKHHLLTIVKVFMIQATGNH
jgi:hypothetical protein